MNNQFTSPTTAKTPRRQQGSAFLSVLFLTMLIGMAAAGFYAVYGRQLFTGKIVEERIKAREVATGAAAQALAFASADLEALVAPPAIVTGGQLGEGSYAVEITPLGNDYFLIRATGTVKNMTETVKLYIRSPYDPRAFRRALFANGDIEMSGGGSVQCNLENGSHSNSDTDISGKVKVAGDAVSVGMTTLRGNAKVGGVILSGADRIRFPRLDFDHYYNIAKDNGQVYNGDLHMKGDYSPPGGVMWVVGDVQISSHTTIHGALFATGSVHQAGSCDIYQVATLPAIASRDGNIFLSGQSKNMQGIIYAASGKVDVTGSHGITGMILAWGDIILRGSWGVIDYNPDKPVLDEDDQLEILAWEY
jgi:hypothetical protein